MAIDFARKNVVVLGVANEKSIAWAITQALHKAGAKIALTYVNEAIERRVRPLAESIGCELVLPCDVQDDNSIALLANRVKAEWGVVHSLVHSVAYAEREDLNGPFVETSREGFKKALDISAYSLIATLREFKPILAEDSSALTLTYLGSERVIENYNVMGVAKAALESSVRYLASDLGRSGVRVNGLSAGPIKTLAASGIPKFRQMLSDFSNRSPLGRNVTLQDVANSALYLLSPLSSGVTGEIHYVDCGYNIVGL
jgi:enoyl-[acyl-carrier protein] reductase I